MKEKKYMLYLINIFKWTTGLFLGLGLFFYALDVFAAASSDQGVAQVANNVIATFSSLAKLVTALAYVSGMGFAMASILKFKAHKDNPTQIPIGTPIALLFVAAALLFLPSLFTIAGETVFGTSRQSGGISGTDTLSST